MIQLMKKVWLILVLTLLADSAAASVRVQASDATSYVTLVGDKSASDYKAGMDITVDSGSTGNNKALLVVRARHSGLYGDFYYAAGFSGGTKLVLEKSYAGKLTILQTVDIGSYVDGRKRKITVQVLDNIIDVYLDGEHKIQYTDASLPNLKGCTGSYGDGSNISFGTIEVTTVEDLVGGCDDNEFGGNFGNQNPIPATVAMKDFRLYDGSGNELNRESAIPASDDIKITGTLIKNPGFALPSEQPVFVAAMYDGNNQLADYTILRIDFATDDQVNVEAHLQAPVHTENCKVKVFLWADIQQIAPLAVSARIY